jgi:hypothetical protein
VLLIAALSIPVPSFAGNASATCGGTEFEVAVENRGHPLDNVYRLLAKRQGQGKATQVHLSDLGGWFFAACVLDKQGAHRSPAEDLHVSRTSMESLTLKL